MSSLPDLNYIFGPLLASSWLSSTLLCLVVVQTYRFFSTHTSDAYTKAIVVISGVSDVLGTIALYALVYIYVVTHWGDVDILLSVPKVPLVFISVTTSLNTLLCQAFLTVRVWSLYKNYFLVVFLALLALGGFAHGLLIAYAFDTAVSVSDPALKTYAITWFSLAIGDDVFIALALIIKLQHMQKTLDEGLQYGITRLRKTVSRMTFRAFETGAITSVVATTVLATYLGKPNTYIGISIGCIMGRVYTLVMMANLNASQSTLRSNLESSKHTSATSYQLKTITANRFPMSITTQQDIRVDLGTAERRDLERGELATRRERRSKPNNDSDPNSEY